MRRRRYFIYHPFPLAVVGAAFLLATAPARANLQLPPLDGLLQTSVRIPGIGVEVSGQDIADIVENSGDYLDFLRGRILGALSQEFCNGGPSCPHDDLLEGVLGPLGLPDPEATEQVIYEILEREAEAGDGAESGGAFGMNSAAYGMLAQHDLDVATADVFAESQTNAESQQLILDNQARATAIANGSLELAAQGQSLVVTQDVMKLLLQQGAQGMEIDRMLHNELSQTRLATAWNVEVSNDLRRMFVQQERERQMQIARGAVDAFRLFPDSQCHGR